MFFRVKNVVMGPSQPSHNRIATLDLVRVIGMFLVMCLHSPTGTDGESTVAIFLLHNFIANGAVPVFFLLSGYLAARKLEAGALTLGACARHNARAYVIPYLFWNVLVLLLVLLAQRMGLAAHWRGGGTYFDLEPTFGSITAALFGIGRNPIVFQFWFLRDLIVVSLIAWWLCRRLPRFPLLPWLLFFVPLPMASSLAYYLLGCQLRGQLPPEKFPSAQAGGLYLVGWLLLGSAMFAGLVYLPYPLRQLGGAAFIFMLAILLAATPLCRQLAILGPATFFVYAIHEPLETMSAKCWQAARLPAFGSLFCFLVIPAVVFAGLIILYFALSRIFPRLMAVATGERQWPKDGAAPGPR